MKNILYLSFYFEPDLCAGSFRNSPLAFQLAKIAKGHANVHVFTTMPNRYNSFSEECPEFDVIDNIYITRILLPKHKSGFFDQIKSFLFYFKKVKQQTKNKSFDLVFASSSRLFTAFLGYNLASRKNIPLYLDIRDIFVDTIKDVITSNLIKIFLLPLLKVIEFKVFNYANHINLISPGFNSYFIKYKKATYSNFTNGIDDQFVFNSSFEESLSQEKIVITYAGNIGEGQGLHLIIPAMAQELGSKYQIRVIGDGGVRKKLEQEIVNRNILNVSIENPVKREKLVEVYKQSHFLFMHLNDYPAFEKVLPSKVFELGAFPRPIIAGVAGYASDFLEENISEKILFKPNDVNSFIEKIRVYNYQLPARNTFIEKFNRNNINTLMAKSIYSYV
jgi:glycosyltransferase involved in cell wall biosynthesis